MKSWSKAIWIAVLLFAASCADETKGLESAADSGTALDFGSPDSGEAPVRDSGMEASDGGAFDAETEADSGPSGFDPGDRRPGEPELPRDLFPACADILENERYCLTTQTDDGEPPVFAVIGVESGTVCAGAWRAPALVNNIAFHEGELILCDSGGANVTFLPLNGTSSISYASSNPCDATVEFQSGFGVGAAGDFMLFDDREAFAADNASGRARLFDAPQIFAGNAAFITGMYSESDGRVFYTEGGLVNQELRLQFFTPEAVRGMSFLGGEILVVLTADQLKFYSFPSGRILHAIGLERPHGGLRCF